MRSEVDAVPQCENYGILLLGLLHENSIKLMISQTIDNQKWISESFFFQGRVNYGLFHTVCVLCSRNSRMQIHSDYSKKQASCLFTGRSTDTKTLMAELLLFF